MLFDPSVVTEQPLALAATIAIIVLGKSVAAYAITRAFGHPNATAYTVSASLAQIGEFSFILAGLGVSLGLLPDEGRDLVLAGAIGSILLHPFIFATVEDRRAAAKKQRRTDERAAQALADGSNPARSGHVVLVGYGRVGRLVGAGLSQAGRSFIAIEDQSDVAAGAEPHAREIIVGNAADPEVLSRAGIAHASKLVIAIPEGFEAGEIAERARELNPGLAIIARAHSDEEVEHLRRLGAHHVVMGEREIADRMLGLAAEIRHRSKVA
jgi:CPA2 family monovalent cation:H+ antiporter-2